MVMKILVLSVLILFGLLAAVSNRGNAEASEIWPGPNGVTATDGMSPGEAVLTWSTVEKAAYYRIGWIAGAKYQARADAGADWQEGFVFIDVANRGQASHLVTGLTPGEEYRFVVASHDGHLPKAPQPVEVAALRLREDDHPNEYAPPGRPDGDADSRLIAGGGVPPSGGGVLPSVNFQNSGACTPTLGSGTVTMFGEDVNRYLCQDTQGSIYRIFVPVQYTSADAIAQGMHGRANNGMQNLGKRVAIYKALILELAIQKALQDRNHEDVYVDFLQTGRDISNDANEVADYVRAGYDLADLGAAATAELAKHIDHVLHSTTLELGGKLGTHAFDVAMAAAVNRTIDIQTARGNVWLLAQLPVEDPAWADAIARAGVDLDQMVSEHALDRWGEALEQNFEEIKRTVAILIAKKVAVAAVHALGAKVVIATAPISLTVGLAATAGVIIFFETGDFWKDLSLASVAAQVYWDTQQHGNETDADVKTRQGLLDYAKFSFYQHMLQAADNVAADLGAIWNLGNRTPTQFYLSILARRDLALAPLTGSRWEPAKDFKTLNPDGKRQGKEEEDPDINQDPRGLWANEKIMWVQDAIDGNIYAYDFENKARVPTRDINTRHFDIDGATRNPEGYGIWSDGNAMWMMGRAPHDYKGRLYAYALSDGSHSQRKTWYWGDPFSDFNLGGHSGIGLWSDRTTTTMWMADHKSDRVYAYARETKETDDYDPLLTGAPVFEKALFGLSAVGNEYAAGIWSDGTTMWVADKSDAKVYAYDLATGRQDVTREFDLLDVPGIVSNTNPSGIWSDGTTMWVANEADPDPRRFLFTSVIEALGDILAEQLANLGLGDYSASDQATRVLDLHGDQIFAYELPRTSVPAEAIPYRRNPAKDLARMASAGNHHAQGIWSDGTTMWVADHDADRIYAYRLSDGARDEASGFDLHNRSLFEGNHHARGIWSDGTTMWVADHDDDRIYAYRLSDGARVEELEFGDDVLKAAGNEYATGIWFDATAMTMWVADRSDKKIYGYDLSNPNYVRLAGTIGVLDCAGNDHPWGIWSDGATMWVGDDGKDRIYAYSMRDNLRDPSKEFDILAGANNRDPRGIWSDGDTMWVADDDNDWVYAYNMPDKPLLTPVPAIPGTPSRPIVAPLGYPGVVIPAVVIVKWTASANANFHLVYLTSTDGTEHRYLDRVFCGNDQNILVVPYDPIQLFDRFNVADRTTAHYPFSQTLLNPLKDYQFRVIAGRLEPDGTVQWSEWSRCSQVIRPDGASEVQPPLWDQPTDLCMLSVGPAKLEPAFKTGERNYSATTVQRRVTITPASDQGASFTYSVNNVLTRDGDPTLPGFQADLECGANTVEIKVASADGEVSDTYTIDVTRETGIPPEAPVFSQVFGGPESLQLRFPPADSNCAGLITWYYFRYSEDGVNWQVIEKRFYSTQFSISDLTPGTAYRVQAQARTKYGVSPWSATATGTPKIKPARNPADAVGVLGLSRAFVGLLHDDLEIVYVVDTSGSMSGSKLDQLKIALASVRDKQGVDNTAVALVRFSTSSSVLLNFVETGAGNWNQEWTNAINGLAAVGSTEMYAAMRRAVEILPAQDNCPTLTTCRGRDIVLMTDGQAGDSSLASTAINEAVNKGVQVHTVAFGTDAEEAALQNIATQTGGTYVKVQPE